MIFFIRDYSILSAIFIILAYLSIGMTDSSHSIANTSKLFQISPEHHKALYMSLVSGVAQLTGGISALSAGIVIDHFLPFVLVDCGIKF